MCEAVEAVGARARSGRDLGAEIVDWLAGVGENPLLHQIRHAVEKSPECMQGGATLSKEPGSAGAPFCWMVVILDVDASERDARSPLRSGPNLLAARLVGGREVRTSVIDAGGVRDLRGKSTGISSLGNHRARHGGCWKLVGQSKNCTRRVLRLAPVEDKDNMAQE